MLASARDRPVTSPPLVSTLHSAVLEAALDPPAAPKKVRARPCVWPCACACMAVRVCVYGRARVREQGAVHDCHDCLGPASLASKPTYPPINQSTNPTNQPLDRPTKTCLQSIISQEWRELMGRLATSSCATYRSIVYNTPEFYPYFAQATAARYSRE